MCRLDVEGCGMEPGRLAFTINVIIRDAIKRGTYSTTIYHAGRAIVKRLKDNNEKRRTYRCDFG